MLFYTLKIYIAYIIHLFQYMAKSSDKKIKDDKSKIIQQLKIDARQSPNNIAKKLGFSRQKVWRYIKELEKEKIWGYTAVIDELEDDTHEYFALIKQRIPYLENIDQIITNLKAENSSKLDIQLVGLFYTNGPYDAICKFKAKDIKEAKKYLGYIAKEYGDLVVNIDLCESVFPMVQFGKLNPKLDELKEFSIETV